MDNILAEENKSITNSSIDTGILDENEKRKLRERAKQSKVIREQLKKQIEECSSSEAFNDFTKTQKKQSKKKVIITSIICMLLIATSGVVIYFKIFARNDIQRGTDLNMSYDDVIQTEKYKYDSKEPEAFGEIMLCYSDVKYKNLKCDAFYYFDAPKGNMYVTSMKFDYNKDTYDYLLKSLSKEYGDYSMDEYNVTYPNVPMWKEGDKLISILTSEESNVLEVVIEYA